MADVNIDDLARQLAHHILTTEVSISDYVEGLKSVPAPLWEQLQSLSSLGREELQMRLETLAKDWAPKGDKNDGR
jgi:hypothetical protein